MLVLCLSYALTTHLGFPKAIGGGFFVVLDAGRKSVRNAQGAADIEWPVASFLGRHSRMRQLQASRAPPMAVAANQAGMDGGGQDQTAG